MKTLRKVLQFIADIILLPIALILWVVATLVYLFSPDDERTRNWVKSMQEYPRDHKKGEE